MQKNELEKEAISLEYQKLLSEYNTLSIALASVTLGIAGLVYTLMKDILFTLASVLIVYIIVNTLKKDKSKELNEKVKEIRNLDTNEKS